jgi:hypothetical protein
MSDESYTRDEWLRRGYQLGHVYEGDDGQLASHYWPIRSTGWRWDWKPREPSRAAFLDEAYAFVAQVYSEIWGEELAALLAAERARAAAKQKEEARRKAADDFFEEMLKWGIAVGFTLDLVANAPLREREHLEETWGEFRLYLGSWLTLAVDPRMFQVRFRTGLGRSYMPTAEAKLTWHAEEPAVRGRGEIKEWNILVQDFSTANAVNALAHQVRHAQRETARAVPFWDKDGHPLSRFPAYASYDSIPDLPRGRG